MGREEVKLGKKKASWRGTSLFDDAQTATAMGLFIFLNSLLSIQAYDSFFVFRFSFSFW